MVPRRHANPAVRPPPPIDVSSNEWLDKVETEGLVVGMRISVFNFNNDERSLEFAGVTVTARMVCEEMAAIEGVSEDARDCFALWIIGDDLELQYRMDDDIFRLIQKFPRYVQKYTHKNLPTVSWRLYFKREALLPLARERKVKDPSAIRLLYNECAFNILDARYPTPTEEDAIVLAGMQMQLIHGDHRPDVHKAGFLTQPNWTPMESLLSKKMLQRSQANRVGISMGAARAPKYLEWEQRILAEHAKHKGKPRLIMQLLYLQLVRSWPYYGSTFFTACSSVPPQGYFEYRDHTLLVGVNASGIHVIDNNNNKLISSFLYDDINWDVQQDTLVIEYGPLDAPLMAAFISPRARMAGSIITHAIRLLDEKDASDAIIRAQQAQQRALEDQARRIIVAQ